MAQNRAAWIKSEKANPLQVDDAPMPKPGPGEVVFKNHAVAVVCIPFYQPLMGKEYAIYANEYVYRTQLIGKSSMSSTTTQLNQMIYNKRDA